MIGSALALATHYYALLVVAPEALWLLSCTAAARRSSRGRRGRRSCGLALIPLAISQNGTGHASWIARSRSRRLEQITPVFLVGFRSPPRPCSSPLA